MKEKHTCSIQNFHYMLVGFIVIFHIYLKMRKFNTIQGYSQTSDVNHIKCAYGLNQIFIHNQIFVLQH